MTKAEKTIALFLAASAVGALALVACQELAGGVIARVLDVKDAPVWGGLGLGRFAVFKLGLLLAVLPWILDRAGEERRLVGGLLAIAVFTWVATSFVFVERELGATYALLGVAATFASAFEGWRRWAASFALGLVVAGTFLAVQGESLAEGKNFGAAIVLGLAFCGPAIAAIVFAPAAVARGLGTIEARLARG
jgi:cell division protein FtsW (lipid II flippase)